MSVSAHVNVMLDKKVIAEYDTADDQDQSLDRVIDALKERGHEPTQHQMRLLQDGIQQSCTGLCIGYKVFYVDHLFA